MKHGHFLEILTDEKINYKKIIYNINQYYNSSAQSARNALAVTFPNKFSDLGLQ